jgi:hypothetical protein
MRWNDLFSASMSMWWASERILPFGFFRALSITLVSPVDMLFEVPASFMFPSQGSNQHGPPLLGRVPVPYGSPASSLLFGPPTSCHPSASAHLPIAFGLPPGACLFLSELRMQTLTARSPELGHRRSAIAGYFIEEMAGSPELPGRPLRTRHGRTPRRMRHLRALCWR